MKGATKFQTANHIISPIQIISSIMIITYHSSVMEWGARSGKRNKNDRRENLHF